MKLLVNKKCFSFQIFLRNLFKIKNRNDLPWKFYRTLFIETGDVCLNDLYCEKKAIDLFCFCNLCLFDFSDFYCGLSLRKLNKLDWSLTYKFIGLSAICGCISWYYFLWRKICQNEKYYWNVLKLIAFGAISGFCMVTSSRISQSSYLYKRLFSVINTLFVWKIIGKSLIKLVLQQIIHKYTVSLSRSVRKRFRNTILGHQTVLSYETNTSWKG